MLQGVLHPGGMQPVGAVCGAGGGMPFYGGYQIRKCFYCEYLMCIHVQIKYMIPCIGVNLSVLEPMNLWDH